MEKLRKLLLLIIVPVMGKRIPTAYEGETCFKWLYGTVVTNTPAPENGYESKPVDNVYPQKETKNRQP